MFNVVFHREGEFIKLNDGDTIYMGGVSIILSRKLIYKWSMVNIHKWMNNGVTQKGHTENGPKS